jgi:acetylornithine/succinyldiaminopimelate/putrescine aminotransferase
MIATRQMREKDVTGNVMKRSKQIMTGLKLLKEKHSNLEESRGLGLMIAFRLLSSEKVAEFQKEMAKNNVKTSLSTREWVRLLPPLILSEDESEHLLSAIDKSLGSI